ncbi:hypothetical protein CFOL_v3_33225 [Cephalotus follicularis]|uniref:Uncharacterized protein n=1 Tax=Cephalotus follicularis TaxID=3775 RepID=A0A1Q3DBX0_CEPFO|nr:hypothetical protein CFOL_v3_33225 [Cephalotus follicularis]
MQDKIKSLENNIINNLCSELPDAFWHRKRHMISLPYEKKFTKQNIPTKARPIQMNHELMEHCKKEIGELLCNDSNSILTKDVKNLASKQIFAR